jgi:hypothetical protein
MMLSEEMAAEADAIKLERDFIAADADDDADTDDADEAAASIEVELDAAATAADVTVAIVEPLYTSPADQLSSKGGFPS